MSEIPEWFWEAVDQKPASNSVEVDDIDINYLTWSEPGKRGLLFVHGHNAHAHWWDFIAPHYSPDWQVVALDLSGMGDSDHRDEYATDTYAREIVAVADAAGMPDDTIVVAHSFGGVMAMYAAAANTGRFGGLVLLDTGVRHPDDIKEREPERFVKPKVYPEFDIAKSRFRLQPIQPCANSYLVDYIARNSIEPVDDGWGWKFDEELNSRMRYREDGVETFRSLTLPTTLIYGELSESFSKKSAAYMKELLPALEVIELADAQHHLFLDQPLAFMETLDGVLAGFD